MPYPARARQRMLPVLCCLAALAGPVRAASICNDEQPTPQVPTDLALCAELDPIVRKPGALPLDEYEVQLNRYVSAMCHRNFAAGWQMDKTVRDTGPFIATLANGKWSGAYFGTHSPVLIWYSPEMMAWLHANRPSDPSKAPAEPAPVPDGAIMVKEMYNPPPASACRVPDLLRLRPNSQGMAVMVRDSAGARDGWFWGAIGWQGWVKDWPPPPSNSPPFAGFGQYCTNCHASARDNQTFASLGNIKDEPGTYLTFLSEDFYRTQSDEPYSRFSQILQHQRVRLQALRMPPAQPPIDAGFAQALQVTAPPSIGNMPSQAYDHAWVSGAGPDPASTFVTSDQCVGCHSAGGTGLQYEMTTPGPNGLLVNLSPYGTWRTSPMGLAGRDPIFFAQLASETQTFHPAISPKVQDTCLGCHGILGQRQAAVDSAPAQGCPDFLRETVNAVPLPAGQSLGPAGPVRRPGARRRFLYGVPPHGAWRSRYREIPGCAAEPLRGATPGLPQSWRQRLCPHLHRQLPGRRHGRAVRAVPGSEGDADAARSRHPAGEERYHHQLRDVRHLSHGAPAGHAGRPGAGPCLRADHLSRVGLQRLSHRRYAGRQAAVRGGPAGAVLPGLPHAEHRADGSRFRSKIAGIQENSDFPQVENGLPAKDIDLPVRDGFARHVLVGLNVFLIEMADQFSSVFGIARQDPMLGSQGVPPLDFTRDAMLEQADRSAAIGITDVESSVATLAATVTVSNKSGHKLPSGVGFRRAFVDFRVLDSTGDTLWESGRTNSDGVLIDQLNRPIAGELWWKSDCSARAGSDNPHQPHYQSITRQDQVQIYQELVTAPPTGVAARCGPHAAPTGEMTTSFMSICGRLKDNRLLPTGFLPLDSRIEISRALGAGADMAEDTDPIGVGDDPDYRDGGADTLTYRIPRGDIAGRPASVEATLYYQATPPYFLQDRFCTATGIDRDRLAYIASALKLEGTAAAGWKLQMVTTGRVALPQ